MKKLMYIFFALPILTGCKEKKSRLADCRVQISDSLCGTLAALLGKDNVVVR